MTRIVWKVAERDLVVQSVREILEVQSIGATTTTVKAALLYHGAQHVLEPDRRRMTFSPVELRKFVTTLMAPREYQVPGRGSMTVSALVTLVTELDAEIQALKNAAAAAAAAEPEPVTISVNVSGAPPHMKFEQRPLEVLLPPKLKVAVAGVFEKHRVELQQKVPTLDIVWVDPHNSDTGIKRKCSSRPCVICSHGSVNSRVIKLIHNIASECHQGNGVHFVAEKLREFAARSRK